MDAEKRRNMIKVRRELIYKSEESGKRKVKER